ncbi:unnamed protein product [Rhizoctonia solani]|nr:unnamed protein product [Rhizoctonia solani]
MGSTSLQDLAAELVIRILHFCDNYRSIVQFSATSRRYMLLVQDLATLQLRIELGANEMEMIDGSTYNYLALLQRLRRYQEGKESTTQIAVINEYT